ncbi:molybdopterin molybdotransferase MoeA [Oceanobacillus indicireducens]|uniref:Molybdopterin molybdenumtransferase n=1 Tax=Oceanobacillus indicireducens TaxID=1004261 RepID=A0A917XX65_9BACI|nr:gephyrin-like molybdotransferase Glp [Oceanobacillus indicireducens]GGN56082.1 molybdopterin molybdenumtransferase [Oceanobacillus indicireducens]
MFERKSIQLQEAVTRLMKFANPGEMEYLSPLEATGFYLAEGLVADHPVPPFDRSPYDGFAIRSSDTARATTHNPSVLKVVGEIGAGQVFSGTVGEKEAVRIMTGAAIPDGCDAVIMIEAVREIKIDDNLHIQVRRPMKANKNISFTGEDVQQGTVVAEAGKYINPGVIALLATFGYTQVPVRKRPATGILVTGSELLDLDDPLEPGKIRNSNGYMIHSQALRAGAEPIYLGKLSDDLETNFESITTNLKKVDILITTGGVSVGDYDFMPEIFNRLGANVLFNKIGMRPGSVTTVAEKNGKLIFALSGNPSACYVGFELLARPFIRAVLGARHPFSPRTTAILGADFLKKNPFDRFVRGKLELKHGTLFATPSGLDKSGVVSSLAEADCLIVFLKGRKESKKGEQVEVILLDSKESISMEDFFADKVRGR